MTSPDDALWAEVEARTRHFALSLFKALFRMPCDERWPGGGVVGETFTPGKIIRWLRGYAEWREEVDAGISVYGSSAQGELASYRKGGYPGGPTARAAVRYVDLSERVRTVEWWLGQLEPWERIAADYWINVKTLPTIAAELGVEYRQARRLTEVLPVVVWLRAYYRPCASASG